MACGNMSEIEIRGEFARYVGSCARLEKKVYGKVVTSKRALWKEYLKELQYERLISSYMLNKLRNLY